MKKQLKLVATLLVCSSTVFAAKSPFEGTSGRDRVVKPGERPTAERMAETRSATARNEAHAVMARNIEKILGRPANSIDGNKITAFAEVKTPIKIQRNVLDGLSTKTEAIEVSTATIVDGYMEVLNNPNSTKEQKDGAALGLELIAKAGQIEAINSQSIADTSEAIKFLRDHVNTLKSQNDGTSDTTPEDVTAYSVLLRTAVQNASTMTSPKLHEVYKTLDPNARERQKNCEEKA
jgi:hypothetical protein